MDYFPAFLDLRGRSCLVVGAGAVAARKIRLLLAAGAEPIVVAPEAGAEMRRQIAAHGLPHLARRFGVGDVAGRWLVVCAVGDPAVRAEVSAAAEAAGVFCNAVDDAGSGSFITPAIVDRGAVVVAVSSGGAAPVLARRVREQIEALLPSTLAQLAALAGRWRDRVARGIHDAFRRRRFWEQVFDGAVAHQAHAGRHESAEQALAALLRSGASGDGGQAWLVGAGPGDPELLTLRALQVLQQADVIVHDRLVSDEVLARARRDAERIAVGKAPGGGGTGQREINELLISLVTSGKRVCRLKGGDPFIFGRGGEEAEALARAGLPVTVVPGITAAAGCAAYSGIPLTHRDVAQSVVLLTAHGKDSVDSLDWPSLARDRQTLAVYMAVRRFPVVMNRLIEHGRPADTPIAIVENGTTPAQRIVHGTLGQLTLLAEAHRVTAPAMLIVGEVVARAVTAAAPSRGNAAGKSAIHKLANNT